MRGGCSFVIWSLYAEVYGLQGPRVEILPRSLHMEHPNLGEMEEVLILVQVKSFWIPYFHFIINQFSWKMLISKSWIIQQRLTGQLGLQNPIAFTSESVFNNLMSQGCQLTIGHSTFTRTYDDVLLISEYPCLFFRLFSNVGSQAICFPCLLYFLD